PEKQQENKPVVDLGYWSLGFMAVFALFWGLGYYALWGSEDRWAEIVREMMLNKDFLHPAINGQVYFDKPLLSYWLIAAVAYLFDNLDEFIVRMPSALTALAAVFGTVYIGRKLFDRQTGLTSGWILLSSFGFLFWGRSAAADIENLAAIVLAVAWFMAREEKAGFFSYLLFYLVCFLGAMTKGLPAVVVPLLVVTPYLLMESRWKKHLRFSNFFAFLIGGAIYLLPFYLAARLEMPAHYFTPISNLNGLELVWQENILRIYDPLDHNEEYWFCYFYHIPRIIAPWIVFFIPAVITVGMRWKKLDKNDKWLSWATLLVFIVFSASSSRRWYYILPIAPFCAVMAARFLCTSFREDWERLVIEVVRWVIVGVAIIEAISIVFASLWKQLFDIDLPWTLLISIPVFGIITLAVMFIDERGDRRQLAYFTGMPESVAAIILGGTIIICGMFSFQFPSINKFRSEKPFALRMKNELINIRPENIIFYPKIPVKLIFYMNFSRPAHVVTNVEDMREIIKSATGKIAIVSYNREKYFRELKKVIPGKIIDNPNYKEELVPFEDRKKARKLCVWLLNNK
ncbi:MAG: glycosyltransferase family 39 protein, partial [Victivallaceae bacterium]|nr:glycosyltransferase family 39 protein [Victivallaceae bacterium]